MNNIIKISKHTGKKQSHNAVRIYIPKIIGDKLNNKVIFNYKDLTIKTASIFEKRGYVINEYSNGITIKVPEDMLSSILGEYSVEEENEIYYLTKI